MVLVWKFDDSPGEPELPHKAEGDPYIPVEELQKIGIFYWKLTGDADVKAEVERIKADRGYIFHEDVIISKDKLPDYEKKIYCFHEEHIHTDEEVRFVQEGAGYFDVRDKEDQWIRIRVEAGDFLVLPAGLYHRFTRDANDYIKHRRFYQQHPVWTPYYRPCADDMPARTKYLHRYGKE